MTEPKVPPHLRTYRVKMLVADPETGLIPMPPIPEAEAFARFQEEIRQWTPEDFFRSMVEIGVFNPDGTLTEYYRHDDDDELDQHP